MEPTHHSRKTGAATRRHFIIRISATSRTMVTNRVRTHGVQQPYQNRAVTRVFTVAGDWLLFVTLDVVSRVLWSPAGFEPCWASRRLTVTIWRFTWDLVRSTRGC